MQKMVAGTDNEVFAHYIFMDNKFSLSTASGFPLKFSLSGTFAPGAKGGLRFHRNMVNISLTVLCYLPALNQHSFTRF